ncbi:MAG: hypothetical protein K940chlam7_01920, partial [Chlamydiae bacterium]|nr:hypothetical protein [Chlamydiota bacterium]
TDHTFSKQGGSFQLATTQSATRALNQQVSDRLPASTSHASGRTSWGKGIAASVLGGLLISAGSSWSQNSNQNSISDAIAMMKGTLGPAAFKAAFVFQISAIAAKSKQGGGALSGALLTGMMLLPERVKGQLSCPQSVGSYDTPGPARSVAVSGNYAYVAGDSGLQIIDVANVANPTLAGSYDTPGWAFDVVLSGNYAYVANEGSGLLIIDVSNVTNPTLTGSYDTPGAARGVAISGNYAYVGDQNFGLQIIDISNVANPMLVGFYNTPDSAWGVAVSGNYAYVGDYRNGLQIIDVSNVAIPTLVGSYNTPDWAYDVAIFGSYAFVADAASGLQIIDVSNVTNPTLAGSYNTPGQAWSVVVLGNYAYVTDYISGLQILDVSNVANPTLAGFYNTPGWANGVAVSGTYAYVADRASGLQIISLPCSTSSSSSTTSSSSTFSTRTSSSTTTSSGFLASTIKSTTMDANLTTASNGTPLLWLGLLGGGLCVCLIGGTFFILRGRRKSSNHEASFIERGSTTQSIFELKPIVKRGYKKIGEKYYQLSTIAREEAEEIYEQTGHLIVFPEGKKKIQYVIGKGHFGAIKVAQRIKDGQYVASKKVKGEESMRVSEEEASMQKAAAGENVLPIYNTIRLEETLYHFMPLAGFGNGREIQSHLSALNNPMLATEILKFVTQNILTGLKTIHGKGIYHLDIKPENTVFTKDGIAYITDFGCAKKAKDKSAQMSWEAIGDNRYFSPERLQACKEKSQFGAEKADIWAAGMTVLQMIKDLSPLQLFEMPGDFSKRVHVCTQDYFLEKLHRFEELQKPEEWDIWWVIKGLLDPNAETRLTAEKALQAPCFRGLKKKTQAHVFEDLQAEKLIQTAGISRDELDLRNYGFASQTVADSEGEFYNTQEHQQYYSVGREYLFTPDNPEAIAAADIAFLESGYQKTPDVVTNKS